MIKLGGICAIIGSLAFMVAGALHRDLPSGTQNAVTYVADNPNWHVIHLLAILSVALWPIAFAGIATAFTSAWGSIVGKLATGAAIVGFVVYIMDTALDGFVLKLVADAWAAAPESGRQDAFLVAEAIYRALQGTFVASVIWLLGVPFLLLGWAMAIDRAFPRALGWPAAVLGGLVTVSGMTFYLELGIIPDLVGFVVPSFLLTLWLLIVGILTLRRRTRIEAGVRS